MIVKEGQVKITIAGQSKILGPGSIAFAMPGDEHGIENTGKTQATYYILKYKGRSPNIDRGKQAGGSFMLDWNDLKTNNTGKGYRRDFFNRATSQLAQFEMHTTALNADSVSHAPHTTCAGRNYFDIKWKCRQCLLMVNFIKHRQEILYFFRQCSSCFKEYWKRTM